MFKTPYSSEAADLMIPLSPNVPPKKYLERFKEWDKSILNFKLDYLKAFLVHKQGFLRRKLTYQLTPSASTQANLYSFTLSISWRHPATHCTYWELCKRQTSSCRRKKKHSENFIMIRKHQEVNEQRAHGSVQTLHYCHESNLRQCTCSRSETHQHMPETTPQRGKSPSHLSGTMSSGIRVEEADRRKKIMLFG